MRVAKGLILGCLDSEPDGMERGRNRGSRELEALHPCSAAPGMHSFLLLSREITMF